MGLFDLFKPAWQSDNQEKAIKAIEKISNENILKKIVTEAIHHDIRYAAINKINDETFLKEAISKDKKLLWIEVVEKITDETFLKKIVLKHWSNYICEIAIKKITDMEFLKEVALNDKDDWYEDKNHRLAVIAVGMLTNDTYLKEIITKGRDRKVRKLALAKINDIRCLKDVSLKDLYDEEYKVEKPTRCTHHIFEYQGISHPFNTGQAFKEYKCKICGEEKREDYGWDDYW